MSQDQHVFFTICPSICGGLKESAGKTCPKTRPSQCNCKYFLSHPSSCGPTQATPANPTYDDTLSQPPHMHDSRVPPASPDLSIQQPSLSHYCTTLYKQSTYSVSARPTSPGTTLSPRRIMPCPTSPRKTSPDRNGLRVENHMHPQLTLKTDSHVLPCRYDEPGLTLTQVQKEPRW